MFIKSAMIAVLASGLALSVGGCVAGSATESGAENVTETAEALTTGVTFDPSLLYLTYIVNGTTILTDVHYYPGNSSVTFDVPCTATQVGIQANIKYNDTGVQLWPAVTAAVPGLTAVTSNLNPLLQGANENFGQVSNRATSPLTGATADTTLPVVLTLKSYTDSSYTTLSGVPITTMTYYVRRMCTCT